MSIERLPGGKTKVRWRDSTGHRAKTFPKGEYREAKAFHEEVNRAKRLGYLPQLTAGKREFGEVAAAWWQKHGQHKAPRTAEEYERALNKHILPYFDTMRLAEVGPAEIEGWLARPGGPAAKKAALSVLKQVLNYAVRAGYIQGNPCAVVKPPKQQARQPIKPPTPAQVERIRARLFERRRPGDAYLVSVLAYGGLRPHETWWLDWTDVRENSILARSSKTGRFRAVKMLAPLASDMEEWRRLTGGEGLVFPSSTGLEFNKVLWDNWRNRVWQKVAPKGMRPYDCRHAAVSLWLRDPNISRKEAADWAGHGLDVQDRDYAHVVIEGQGSAEEAIEAARSPEAGGGRERCSLDVPPSHLDRPDLRVHGSPNTALESGMELAGFEPATS